MILGYIDPSLGALIWQSIVAAFVGAVFYLKKTRRLVAGFFRSIFKREQKPDAKIPVAEIPAAQAEVEAEVR